jgi:hypothetical protein
MLRFAAALLALALAAAPVAAQELVRRADFPAVDFDRLNSGDPVPGQPGAVFVHTGQGWIIASTTPGPTAPPAPGLPASCSPLPNPYTDADAALRCELDARARFGEPSVAVPAYAVGATYRHPYPGIRMIVLSIATSVEGVPVVTAQFIEGAETGSVFAFKAHQGEPWAKD